MNNKFGIFALYACSAAAALAGAASAHAGQIYIYKDNKGSTLLTNRKSSDRSLTKVKATQRIFGFAQLQPQ